tara:strand:- start:2839 stop:2943 length:105 start_codon:yes stop_codon:yes gene_type:complete
MEFIFGYIMGIMTLPIIALMIDQKSSREDKDEFR